MVVRVVRVVVGVHVGVGHVVVPVGGSLRPGVPEEVDTLVVRVFGVDGVRVLEGTVVVGMFVFHGKSRGCGRAEVK